MATAAMMNPAAAMYNPAAMMGVPPATYGMPGYPPMGMPPQGIISTILSRQ
jgi:hypothetical protein